jgi:transposase
VAYPAYVREKARKLRVEKHLSIDEIATRLALPRTTVYYWLRDLPLGRTRRWNTGQRRGTLNMQRKYAVRRAAA